ncbi:MAG TPA: T9SS type A sorting domain-containing protein, partial [Candidatus Marinimicrobia bacterium]|nr:T9SS type A sorting domain-containing protein [Candidatus Neomarinimicrobiota bacterium]
DASASSDVDGDLLTYKWILEGEVLCDSDSPECTTDELLSGDHEFTLEVCDCYDACVTDQVMVSVEYEDNPPPTIVVDNDNILASIPHDGNPLPNCFEISAEAYGADADGDALTYVWTNLLDGSIESNTSQFAKQFCEEGSYEFEITVTDCYDASSTQLITIEVLPEENVAPIIFSMQLIFEACEEDSGSDLCNFIVSCNPGQQILVNGLNLVCDEDNGADCSVPDYAYSGNSTDQIECTWSTPEGAVEGCEIVVDCPEKDDLWNEFTMSDEELLDASYISGYQLSVTDPYQAYDGNSTESDESVVIASPYLLDQISLSKNVNLISFKWLPDYTNSLNPHPDCVHEDCNGILSNVQGLGVCEVDAIITAGSASTYSDGKWVGSLVELSDENGYWVLYADYQDCDVSIDVIGIETDCEETVYDIAETVLISYVGPNNSNIEDAIHCDEESCIKSVWSNGSAAICVEEGWVGSLLTMNHGKGYWILKKEACEDVVFSWENCEDDTENLARTNEKNHISLSENLTFVNTTSQAFYFINEITLDGVSLSEDKDWYILAYSNETIVGARKWSGFGTDLPVMGYDKRVESSANYPKTGDIISIKLYNNTTGEIINMAFNGNSYPYASNQVYVINSVSNAIISPDNFALGSSYPNPFNPVTTINFALPVDTELSIQIYNLEGRLVEVLTDQNMKAGYHSVIWNADNHSSGVYFVKMISGEYIGTQKLMLV